MIANDPRGNYAGPCGWCGDKCGNKNNCEPVVWLNRNRVTDFEDCLQADKSTTVAPQVEGWNVKLDGSTKLSGSWINGGNPVPATIAYHVQGNVFIIGAVRGSHLKMVKIEVTGETTFDWIDAKYHDPSVTSSCTDQETFSESCFHGKSVSKGNYNVKLVASSGSGKIHCEVITNNLNRNNS